MPRKVGVAVAVERRELIFMSQPLGAHMDGGVLHFRFLSGSTEYTVAIGPKHAVDCIELAKSALTGGSVLPMAVRR